MAVIGVAGRSAFAEAFELLRDSLLIANQSVSLKSGLDAPISRICQRKVTC